MSDSPVIYEGGKFSDKRGNLHFVNSFDFTGVKRFYQISHPDTSVVRAWQGHRFEHKYFYVPYGSFVIAWVEIDDWDQPGVHLTAQHIVLSADKPQVLSVPPGCANGIKALHPDSILTVYSNFSLEESKNDSWSFDASLWMDWSSF